MSKKKRPPIPAGLRALLQAETGGDCAVVKCKFLGQDYHHIDGNPSNNSPDNLIFLCGSHHNEESRNRRYGPTFFRVLKRELQKRLKLWKVAFPAPITDLPLMRKDELSSAAVDEMTKACVGFVSPLLDEVADLIKKNQFQDALAKLRQVGNEVSKTPPVLKVLGPRLYNQMGLCEFHLTNFKAAEIYYQRGMAIQKTWKLQFNLANLYGILEKRDLMLALARSAYRSKPDSPQTATLLGLALTLNRGPSHSRGLALMRTAHRAIPKDAGIAFTLAKSEFLAGNLSRGSKALEIAVQHTPEGADAELLLAMLFQMKAFQQVSTMKGFPICEGVLQVSRLIGGPPETFESNDLKTAIKHFERAIDFGKDEPFFKYQHLSGTYMSLGGCFHMIGKNHSAFHWFRKASELDPHFHLAKLRMLSCLINAEHFKWARSYSDKIAHHFKASRAFKGVNVTLLLIEERFREALPLVRELAAYPDARETEYFNLASVLGALGELGKEFKKARAKLLNQDTTPLNWNIATAMLKAGSCSIARTYLRDILEASPDSNSATHRAKELLAQATYALDGPDDALTVLGESENGSIKRGGSLVWAASHIRNCDWERARQHLVPLVRRKRDLTRREHHILKELVHRLNGRIGGGVIDMGCRIVGVIENNSAQRTDQQTA